MNKDQAIKIAVEIKNGWVAWELQEQYLDKGPMYVVKLDTPDKTILQLNPSLFKDPFDLTFTRPRLEKLNPNKGLLLFLRTIAAHPGHSSFKYYLLLTGNKPTSFSDLRITLVHNYKLVTDKYQLTERGKRLLESYGL